MKGDFSRDTFRATRHFSSVREQQGRVRMDADGNEQADILLHLARTTNGDVIGPSGAPMVAASEFKHFKLRVEQGKLQVAAGRIYVGGVLVENDAILTLADDVPIVQVVSGGNVKLNSLAQAPAGNYFAWLDVWERHVTAVEEPSLREVALGGPDTTTRTQVAWRVMLRTAPDGATCDSVKKLLPAPGKGTLSTSLEPPAPATDPCDLSEGGGYRGLENHFYRVEIQTGGNIGTATFKWSRENGSVVVAVEQFIADTPPTNPATFKRAKVGSLGRDAVLGLAVGDWVEVSNDALDMQAAAGTLAEITSIDSDADGGFILTLDRNVAGVVPGDGGAKASNDAHAKLRRWDQKDGVTADGVLKTAAGVMALEDGAQIEFGGSDLRAGDYWTFAARATTGELELLDDAPARGAHLASALALVSIANDPRTISVTSDCRDEFPALVDILDLIPKGGGSKGCCVSVGDGGDFEKLDEALAKLLDDANAREVNVCLLPGAHTLSGLQITRPDAGPELRVKLSGCGLGSRVNVLKPVRVSGLAAFELSDLNIVSALDNVRQGVVAAENCDEVTIRNCAISGNAGAGDTAGALVALRDIRRALLRDNAFTAYSAESFAPLAQFFLTTEVQLLQALFGAVDGDEFDKAATVTAVRLARLAQAERKPIADRIQRALANSTLTDGEQVSIARLLGSLLPPTATFADVSDALRLIRRAGVQARPAAALLLDTRFVNLEQFGGQVGVFDLVNDNTMRVEDNDIDGAIGLYGLPASANDLLAVLQSMQANLDILHQNARRALLGEIGNGGTLHLRNNRVARVAVSRAMFDVFVRFLMTIATGGGLANVRGLNALLRECFIVNNHVLGANSALICIVCNMNGNAFSMLGRPKVALTPGANVPGDACFVIGDTGVYVGQTGSQFTRTVVTIADITRVSDRAANVGVNVI